MTLRTTRRRFLKQSAVAGVGFWVAGGVSRAARQGPNDTLSLACIGVGGKGSSDADQAARVGNVVAICDVDERFLDAKANQKDKKTGDMPFAKAKKYRDFRKLFDEMGKSIDAVTVSTPDHTHAAASVMAMRLGKHVYCQKPLTHSVLEARTMREVADRMKVATQMGNQGTAENGLRRAVELVQAGVIGPVREAHVWTNRPIWPQAPQITARPDRTDPVPTHLDWDLWIGPAPFRRYVGNRTYHDFSWRGWWDFGTGALGDMACHTANMAFMALKLGHPTAVFGECGDLNPETYPSWATVVLEFPQRSAMPPVKFTWYEGKRDGKKNLPPEDLFHGETPPGSGSLLVGDKGILYSPDDYGAEFRFLGMKGATAGDFASVPQGLPRNGRGDLGMKQEWVAAIRGGPPALSNFGYAALLTETILLGNVALRAGKRLEWDGPNLKFSNAPEANRYLHRAYRDGWTL
jgi:predicted dehydrogenase